MGSKDKDYGYKIFTSELDINLLFDIQNILSNGGFDPKAYEIFECYDDIQGVYVNPKKRWIRSLIEYCKKNKINRFLGDGKQATEFDIKPKNCIRTNEGKIYLVDIDERFYRE